MSWLGKVVYAGSGGEMIWWVLDAKISELSVFRRVLHFGKILVSALYVCAVCGLLGKELGCLQGIKPWGLRSRACVWTSLLWLYG